MNERLPNADDTIRTFMKDIELAKGGDERALAVLRSIVRQLLKHDKTQGGRLYTIALGETALELMKEDMRREAEAN
jgi:hypothetical protein